MSVSLQARLSVWIAKWRVKRRLKGVRDYRVARKILRPDPYKVPTAVQITPVLLGGVPGEPVGSLALAAAQERFIGLADGYLGYLEDPARAERGEGESLRTYYGPGLARSLGLLEER